MKNILILVSVFGMAAIAAAQISVNVYEAGANTPFDGNDVMVGNSLVFIVSSDSNDYWSGGLFIEDQDRDIGTLSGRGYDPNSRDYTGSHYPAAGDLAKVTKWMDSSMWGFDFYTFYPVDTNSEEDSTITGGWFVIDYEANDVGDCNVTFYDYDISWIDPNYFITISNSPSRDLNSDGNVNSLDYSIFAYQWGADGCNDPNWCDGADLDRDSDVDYNDLDLFTEYWLWPSLRGEPNEPNEPNYPADPNIIYEIVDVNGSNEITIDVNETVTLYVDLVTLGSKGVNLFQIEVNISDPNLGSIDNREYDPNDPNSSTACILAEPNRAEWVDYYGPGVAQEEGILLLGTTWDSTTVFYDGNLASFEFTCDGQGDVTLELINHVSWDPNGAVYPTLQSIIIHQNDPYSLPLMGGDGIEEMTLGIYPQVDIEELVSFLEEIWQEDEQLREMCTEEEWQAFIDSVKNSQ